MVRNECGLIFYALDVFVIFPAAFPWFLAVTEQCNRFDMLCGCMRSVRGSPREVGRTACEPVTVSGCDLPIDQAARNQRT